MTATPTTPTTLTASPRPVEPARYVAARSWWAQLPWDLKLAAHIVAFTLIVGTVTGVVMGAWFAWELMNL
jgi:hypothetical protein